jgi:D-amino-acid dehydrogenase
LSSTETKQLFPPLSEEYGSVYVSGGARVNGKALREALIRSAVKRGVTFLKGNASIICSGPRVIGVKAGEQNIFSDKVVVTAGAWANEVIKPLGVEFLVKPQKAQIIHLELKNTDTSKWPVVMPPSNHYLLSFENGRVVAGSTHENEAGFDTTVTAGGINEILSKTLEAAPGLIESTYIETRVGFRPFTPGFLPVMGRLPEFEGIYLANGLGASGLTSGPFLGAELAKLVLEQRTELDLADYDVAGALSLPL